jgi:integrase
MTPREAKARYLRRRRNDATESSVDAWHGRLKLFVEWCEGVGIAEVGDLRPYDLNEYYDLRSGQVQPATVEGEMYTLKVFCEFLDQIGAVEGLAEKVPIPNVPEKSRSSDVKLGTDEALALIEYYRSSDRDYGTRGHAILEMAWFTGARQGGLRALDLRDAYLDENFVEFRHRPGTDTPLKNKLHGERTIGIPAATSDVLRTYIGKYRYEVRDDHGRQPLFASARGRPIGNSFRVWTYQATLPCTKGSCPHGKEKPACEWTSQKQASKCPSSRSPHQIRTGSITWQLNSGIPIEVVSARVNAEPDVISDHYDKPSESELWRRRREQMESRRAHLSMLELTDNDE